MKRPRRALQVLQLRRVLDLASIVEIPGVRPRTVEIRGNRLDLTVAVELNDVLAPGYAVLADNRLLVQVPESMTGVIRTAAVYSNYLDPGGKSVAAFLVGDAPQLSYGKSRVMQNFLKLLLTTPGTDIWSQDTGGGFRTLVGSLGEGGDQALAGDVESRVLQVTRQMLRSQAADPSLLAEERLLSVNVGSITVSPREQKIRIDLLMKFHDGKSLSTGVVW